MLLSRLTEVADTLRDALASLDPERLSGTDADRALSAFAEVERLAAAGRILAARRVESSNVWRRSGHRSAASHVAEATGTGIGPAISTLETARHLTSLPATDEAVRQGTLSESQVKEIAGAAIVQPDAEESLVEAAGQQPLSVLKLRCRRVKAEGRDQQASYAAVRRARYLRNWVEDDGAVRFDARLAPDDGARLLAAVQAEADRLGTAARRAGLREPGRALAADALVALASAGRGHDGDATGSGGSPGAVVHVRVDHAALVRGRVKPGELCEIPGVGPIPVAVARRLSADAILHVLVTDGVDVTAVAHGGRTIPTALRRALVERDPECVVPGCTARERLEIDHLVPFAEGGPASLANLARLCHWHHYLKTHHGHRLERREDGSWCWTPTAEPPVVPGRLLRSG
jgi:hypothetical protein